MIVAMLSDRCHPDPDPVQLGPVQVSFQQARLRQQHLADGLLAQLGVGLPLGHHNAEPEHNVQIGATV